MTRSGLRQILVELGFSGPRLDQPTEEVADSTVLERRVPQGKLGTDLVGVPPTGLPAAEIAFIAEVADNALGGALGDPHAVADLPQAHSGVASHAQQHQPMIAEEVPVGHSEEEHTETKTILSGNTYPDSGVVGIMRPLRRTGDR